MCVYLCKYQTYTVLAVFHDLIVLIDIGAFRKQKLGLLKCKGRLRPFRIGTAAMPGTATWSTALKILKWLMVVIIGIPLTKEIQQGFSE